MKLSCLPVSLFKNIIDGEMSVEYWGSEAVAMGLDAIDVSVLFFKNRTRMLMERTVASLKLHKIPVAMVTTYPDFTNRSAEQRKRELAYLMSDIALASELGANYLRITAGQYYPGLNTNETIANIAEFFSQSVDFARQFGVGLLFENHAKPSAWENNDYCFDTERFIKLYEAVENLDIGINFDTANTMAFGDDPLPVFKRVFNKVKTIHIADMIGPRIYSYTEIGQGSAPICEILSYAKNNGFDGLLSIEEASGKGLEGIKRAVCTIRKLWEEL